MKRREKKLLRTRPFPEQVFDELVLIITISRAEMNQEIKSRQKHKKTTTESILYLVLRYRSRGYLQV